MTKTALHGARDRVALRAARLDRGWSQEDLAEKAGLNARSLGRIERGEVDPLPDTVRRLSRCLGRSPKALGLLPHGRVLEDRAAGARRAVDDSENVRRRDLLGLLSLTGSALSWSGDGPPGAPFDWLGADAASIAPARLDDAVLHYAAALNQRVWQAYRAAPQKGVVLQSVLGQLQRLTDLTAHPRGDTQQRRLCALIADLAQLAGEVEFDADRLDAAARCYGIAADAAKQAGEHDLWACALVRHAFVVLYDQRPHQAVPLLQAAGRIASRGDSTLATRHWVAAVAAEAYAGTGNLAACQRALDVAEGVGAGAGSNGAWLRFDGGRLPEERGACYVRLRQPALAEPALQLALAQLPDPTRRRGLVLTDVARAALLTGDVEQACAAGTEAAEIARQGHSGVLTKGLRALQTQLTPYGRIHTVADFNRQVRALA